MRWYALDYQLFLFSPPHSSFHLSGRCRLICPLYFPFDNGTGFLMYIFTNCNLAVLFLRLARGLQHVVNPLRLCWHKSSLDARLFLHHWKDSSVIHYTGLPWSTVWFAIAELTSTFLLLNNVPNSYILIFQHNDGHLYWHWELFGPHTERQQQTPNAGGTPRINSRPFAKSFIHKSMMIHNTPVHLFLTVHPIWM